MTDVQTDAKTEATATKGATAKLDQGRGGIIGVKAGMTTVYGPKGEAYGVTVVDLIPNVITQVKTKDKNGYQAVQVGISPKKAKNANKPEQGRLKKLEQKGFQQYCEIRLPDDAKLDSLAVGAVLSPEFLKDGDLVDVTAVSKGRGFAGVFKRYHFGGMNASHGTSIAHRMPGSIGNRADPAKVFKNKKMAGHMGVQKTTIQNVRVVQVNPEKKYLLVHGTIPGPKSGYVVIRRAVKNLEA